MDLEMSLFPAVPVIRASASFHELASTAGAPEVPVGGSPTNYLVQTDQGMHVHVDWSESGAGARLLNGGTWVVEAIAEKVGGGVTTLSASQISTGGGSYSKVLEFVPFSLTPGIYRILSTIQWNFDNGQPGPIAGFAQLATIRIYEEK